MAFPPSKDKKPADKSKPPGGGPPGPGAGAPPGPPQPGAMSAGPPPMPGQGVDPYAAMMGQVSEAPMPVPPMGQGAPMGMPPGMMPPGSMGETTMDDDPMLSALLAGTQGGGSPPGMGGGMPAPGAFMGMPMGGDPYAIAPGEPDMGFTGAGPEDPQMGLQQLLSMLMLAQAGVGGGARMGTSSGLVPDPPTNTMMGLGPNFGTPDYGMY